MELEEWLGPENTLGISIWKKKYQTNDETFEEWLDRVSGGDVEVKKLIRSKKFLFGGRILANRGLKNGGTLSNCYCLTVKDSIESIYDCAKAMAQTFRAGGGVGVDVSSLSPAGARINNAARTTSGAVSFIDVFTTTASAIGSNGRRSALMVSISCDHPDVIDFIKLKTDVNKATTANLSIRVSDDFMKAVEKDEDWFCAFTRPETGECISKVFKARDLFKVFCDANYDYGEPGLLFWDRIEENNMLVNYPDFKLVGTNPCFAGDTKILTYDGEKEIKDIVGKDVVIWNGFEWSTVRPRITGYNQKMLKITFSNKQSVVCTYYHKFVLETSKRVEAKDLKIGDSLIGWKRPDGAFVLPVDVVAIEDVGVADVVYCMTEPKNHTVIANGVITAQCGELPLPDGGACLLGSMNLSEYVNDDNSFNFTDFKRDVRTAIKALDAVQREGVSLHPLEIQNETARNWRQLGLGIMGLGDMLIKMDIAYGTKPAIELSDAIGDVMARVAIKTSIEIGREKGSFHKFNAEQTVSSKFFQDHSKEKTIDAMANSQLLAIAPCGSIATLIGVSSGIEPLFALEYERKTKSLYGKDVSYKVIPDVVKKAREDGRTNGLVCSADIDYRGRVAMQSAWQKHIDGSISSTINLPHEFPRDDIADVYMSAWKNGLKGITVYRDGCAREGILTTSESEDNDGVKDDDLVGIRRKITTGCGSLWLNIFIDKDKRIHNLFVCKGSSGGCERSLIALGRSISLAFRRGATLDEVIDQLESCGVCPSYAVQREKGTPISSGTSCPSAIAQVLKSLDLNTAVKETVKTTTDRKDGSSFLCPECGEKLIATNGCFSCSNPSCTYSKCS